MPQRLLITFVGLFFLYQGTFVQNLSIDNSHFKTDLFKNIQKIAILFQSNGRFIPEKPVH